MQKKVAILGATGSVGTQALDVARQHGYQIPLISANENIKALEAYAREFLPARVAVTNPKRASELRLSLADTPCQVYGGEEGLLEAIADTEIGTTYVNSILGEAGLSPSLAVIEKGERLALANKETLVCAGEYVMERARETGAQILPVDSEHSAIFQCLHAGERREVKRVLLTASGGPFYGKTREELRSVSLADALKHPTWNMGKKITVDSATMMNKGFEIIEAVHLFQIDERKIEVLVHRESIIHSAVEYIDNTVIAELSVPDMRACVQYAVDYPERKTASIAPLDLFSVGTLTFGAADSETFSPLTLARRAATLGGAMGAVLNAADEVAVARHLRGEISFSSIFTLLEDTFAYMTPFGSGRRSYEEIRAIAKEARAFAERYTQSEINV